MTETFVFSGKTQKLALSLIIIGVLGLVIGFSFTDANRVWANVLLNTYLFLGISVTGVFLAAAHQIGYGGWHVLIKRVFEATGSYIPYLGIAVVLLLVGAKMHWHHLYHWMDPEIYNPSSPHYDKILAGKQSYLNFSFFSFRAIAYVILWALFGYLIWKVSVKQDEAGDIAYHSRYKTYAALFLVVFAITSSTSSWDFIMSIDPHWYSTLFGWYNFASLTVSGVAMITLLVLYLKSQGYLKYVNEEHYHNLGLFMFGFSVFWAYLWFSQYMLQWYANLPEETLYFYQRLKGRTLFKVLFYVNLLLCFFFPFLFLMTRAAKRNPLKLAVASIVILVGHWIDFYLMVMPGSAGEHAALGLTELFITLGFAGGFIFVVLKTLTKASLVPVNDPYLKESVIHHTLK
ncbi:MAG: hypothetical protein KatS3mg031_1093 [Chitinophagales bacterium]|nr:MAG: hypothetical protein KatS3mg031_1093 [Chitinophagales bacterium]